MDLQKGVKMKKQIFRFMVIFAAVFLIYGCSIHPQPVTNPNSGPYTEPIHFPIIWGDNELFDEKNAPLAVRVVSSLASQDSSLSELIRSRLNNSYVHTVDGNAPCDLQINVHSEFKLIAPLPQLRMYHLLEIDASSPEGLPMLSRWSHKSEVAEAFSSDSECRSKLLFSAARGVNNWLKNIFITGDGQSLAVSVVRFRVAHYLVDVKFARMEIEHRTLLNQLRKIKGVCNVRTIEVDPKGKIISFRVLYRRKQLPHGIARSIK